MVTNKMAARKSALKHALNYANEGIAVIWIPRNTKAPIERKWPSKATTDRATIKQWAAEHQGCNFGLVMGNGFVAIDIDDPSRIAELKTLGCELTETRVHQTGTGMHLLYRVPENAKIKNSVKLFEFVDVRSAGGQVVCPGSVHPNGRIYEKKNNHPIGVLPDAWLDKLTSLNPRQTIQGSQRGASIQPGARNNTLTSLAGSIRRRGASEDVILEALRAENKEQCRPPLEDAEIRRIAKSVANYEPDKKLEATLSDGRPKVLLPGDNRLVSECASELGEYLRETMYLHNDEVVVYRDGRIQPVSVQSFRTLVERTVVCCKKRSTHRMVIEVGATMTESDARGILASRNFKDRLLPLKQINTCRLPALRPHGRIELLPEGYDAESHILTDSDVEYREDCSLTDSLKTIETLLGEFVFADDGRSKAVAVAALMGLYAKQLIPDGNVRPAFAIVKNAEGAGATTLAACAIVPVLGYMPTGTMPTDEAEMRKKITACVREGQPALVLDNTKGRVSSPSLEAFITSTEWTDRLLGLNENVTGPNCTTVFLTANGATVSPDFRRRALFVELHLDVERAEDRVYKRSLSVDALQSMRSEILAACWGLVSNWDTNRRPKSSKNAYSSFPAWASVVGGIVEAAGFRCPMDTASVSVSADEDGEGMRLLVSAMKSGKAYNSFELAALCRANEVFTHLVGANEFEIGRNLRSAFGYMLKRYDNRAVGDRKFIIEGVGHKRRFSIRAMAAGQHGCTVQHGVSPLLRKNTQNPHKGCKPMSDHGTMLTTITTPKPDKILKFARLPKTTVKRS